jgi:hypothetical protein
MPQSDVDRIDPTLARVNLKSGTVVEIVRLETRQFFRFLKVLTHGAGEALIKAGLNFNASADDFARQMLMLVMLSIPDAEQEAIDFIQSMCRPVGLSKPGTRIRTDEEKKADDALFNALLVEMFNPPLDDTITVIEAVIRQEADDMQALGKRLADLLSLAQRTGQTTPGTPAPVPGPQEMAAADQARTASPASTPASSTSSAPSTDGATNGSSAPRSAVSGRSPRPSPSATTQTSASASS